MQRDSQLMRPALFALCFTVAALSAPPAAFADTTLPPAAPAPPPVTTPPVTTPPTSPLLPLVPRPPADKPVRIGVGRSLTTAEVSAPGGVYVVADGAIHWETPPGQTLKVNLVTGKIQVAGLGALFQGPVRLVPRPAAPGQPANLVKYKNRTYRGEVEILLSPKDRRLSVVNVVNLEEYLLGVVGKEMTPTWPLESLKAQAVAARTFALRNLGKFADEGFNLDDTSNSQVYYGVTGEHPNATRAVTLTKGQVVTFNGLLISTYYSASSGGHTENNENVWLGGTPVDYLRGRPDFDNLPGNLRFAWRYTFTSDELVKLLKAKNRDVGPVSEVRASEKVGPSGRPVQWTVVGATRSVTFSGQEFRALLDLPSAPKSATLTIAATPGRRTYSAAERISVIGTDGKPRQLAAGTVYVVGAAKMPQLAPASVTAQGDLAAQAQTPVTGSLEVNGGGYGHAVGMTQWGAHGLALLGRTYDQILTHYYQGTKVENR